MSEKKQNADTRHNSAAKWPGDHEEDTARLNALRTKVQAARVEEAAQTAAAFDPARPRTSMGLGLKLGVELVVATGIGLALGAGLDVFLGTSPWLLLVFLFLGFAAGIRMVIASADDYRQRIENSGDDGQGAQGSGGA